MRGAGRRPVPRAGRLAPLGPPGQPGTAVPWAGGDRGPTWTPPWFRGCLELPGAVVFPLLHGEAGEDGSLREVLALLGVPVRRLGRLGLPGRLRQVDRHDSGRRGRDPHAAAGGPAARDLPRARRPGLVAALGGQIGFPMMVKPSRGGSALGCSKVSGAAELPAAMVGAYAYGPVAVIEEFMRAPRSRSPSSIAAPGPPRCRRSRSGRTPACTTTAPATPPVRPGSCARRRSTDEVAARVRPAGAPGPRGARAGRPVPDGPDRRPGRASRSSSRSTWRRA